MTTTPYPEALAQAFSGHSDGAHWGINDWYQDIESALLYTLKEDVEFDTGWYSSKKEIWSGRVYLKRDVEHGDTVFCEAQCSDDFDTPGYGRFSFQVDPKDTAKKVLERIREGLSEAIEEAEQDRAANQEYRGWSIGQVDPETGERKDCLYTYIQSVGNGAMLDSPPGDNYHQWGWEDQLDPEDAAIVAIENAKIDARIEGAKRLTGLEYCFDDEAIGLLHESRQFMETREIERPEGLDRDVWCVMAAEIVCKINATYQEEMAAAENMQAMREDAERRAIPELPQHIREAFEDFIIEMRGDRLVVEDWCCEAWDAPKPDPIDAALTENRESPAGGPTP